ncbi:hypothetical protein ACWENQ_18225 [Nonomuraea sp. NPDC004354]
MLKRLLLITALAAPVLAVGTAAGPLAAADVTAPAISDQQAVGRTCVAGRPCGSHERWAWKGGCLYCVSDDGTWLLQSCDKNSKH